MKHANLTVMALCAVMFTSCSENRQVPSQSSQPVPSLSATAPDTGDQVKVDEYPTPVNQIQPKYPQAALDAHAEGTVWLNVLVKADGKTGDITIMTLKGVPELAQAAIEAARQWTFTPAKKDGKAINLRVVIPFRFKLAAPDSSKK